MVHESPEEACPRNLINACVGESWLQIPLTTALTAKSPCTIPVGMDFRRILSWNQNLVIVRYPWKSEVYALGVCQSGS